MGQDNAFFALFGAQNMAFQAVFDVPSNRLIPTMHKVASNKWLNIQPFVI